MSTTDCERARLAMMGAFDGESDQPSALDRQHLSACSSCSRWLADLQAMSGQFEGLSYRSARTDLWTVVEPRIRAVEQRPALPRTFWLIGATVLAWRALQLWVDLPLPELHPVVPLVATIAALWLVARDPLAIETSAPELEKRGI